MESFTCNIRVNGKKEDLRVSYNPQNGLVIHWLDGSDINANVTPEKRKAMREVAQMFLDYANSE